MNIVIVKQQKFIFNKINYEVKILTVKDVNSFHEKDFYKQLQPWL